MKKKIALFMAAVMSITVVPVTSVFAAPDVAIAVADYSADKKEGVYDGRSSTEEISYFLDIVLDEDVEKGSQFIAELTGAKFTNLDGGPRNYSLFDDGDDENGNDDGSIPPYIKSAAINGSMGSFDLDDNGVISNEQTGTQALNTAATAINGELGKLQLLEDEADYIKSVPAFSTSVAKADWSKTYDGMTKIQLQSALKKVQGEITAELVVIEKMLNELRVLFLYNGGTPEEAAKMTTESAIGGTFTSPGEYAATFASFANAGTDTTGRTAWTNMMYVGNKGDNGTTSTPRDATHSNSVNPGTVLVKKTSDTRMRVTFNDTIDIVSGHELVVRIPLPITINADPETVELAITQSSGEIPEKAYLMSDTTAGGTVTTSDGIAKGREIIDLNTILIEESTDGVFESGAFELIAPDGYRFRNRINEVKVTADGDSTFDVDFPWVDVDDPKDVNDTANANIPVAWTDDDDNTSLAVLVGITKSVRLAGTIKVDGLVIEPLDDDAIVDGEELFMTVRDYEEDRDDKNELFEKFTATGTTNITLATDIPGIGVDKEDFKVAQSVDWGVTLTAASVKDLVAGRWAEDVDDDAHATATLTLLETEDDTWRASRTTTFTLPEGVEIRGFKVNAVDGMNSTLGTDADARAALFDKFSDNAFDLGMYLNVPTGTDSDYKVVSKSDFDYGTVSIDENVMSWKNVDVRDDEVTKVEFVLYLSIAPTYTESTIAIQLGGSAIDDEIEPVTIANVQRPITVTTKSTPVQIGYQRYDVADIVIKENFAGAILEADSGLVISMDNDSNRSTGIELVEAKNVTVEGDIKISDAHNTKNQIAFDVIRASKTASIITLSDVQVYVDRTVPYGTYDVNVKGESVFANQNGGAIDNNDDDLEAADRANDNDGTETVADDGEAVFARFGDAYSAEYIQLATEGAYTPLRSHVVISAGSSVALVDGVERTMTDVEPYRTTAEGASFMVPVRFASEIFGVETKDTLWDDATKTFTIFNNGKTIQFIGNADFYRVNGAEVHMTTNGVKIYSEIDPEAGRMYIPFRHLGQAFGIADSAITYNATAETAEYNAPVAE